MATIYSFPKSAGRPVPPETEQMSDEYRRGMEYQLRKMGFSFLCAPGVPAIEADAVADSRMTIEQKKLRARRQRGHLRLVWPRPIVDINP